MGLLTLPTQETHGLEIVDKNVGYEVNICGCFVFQEGICDALLLIICNITFLYR